MVNEYHKKPKLLTCFHNHVRKSNAVISCEKLENYFSIEKNPSRFFSHFKKKNAFAIVKSSVSNNFFIFRSICIMYKYFSIMAKLFYSVCFVLFLPSSAVLSSAKHCHKCLLALGSQFSHLDAASRFSLSSDFFISE